MEDLPESVERLRGGAWDHYVNITDGPGEATGKYLFFSSDRETLVNIAAHELSEEGFGHAKIIRPEAKRGDFVLCLYYRDNSRKHELADRYGNVSGIRYRYWKSNEATRSGEYSETFLSLLSDEEKKKWKGDE